MSRQKSQQRLFNIRLTHNDGGHSTIVIKASTAEIAEKRAKKRNPSAKEAKAI